MAIVRIGGAGAPNLPVPGLAPQATVTGTPPYTAGFFAGLTNAVSLGAGETYVIPSGTFQIKTGPYTYLQYFDPVALYWKIQPTTKDEVVFVDSDGSNFRLANTTGCAVGAVITTATVTGANADMGSAATLVSVSPSAGSSVWVPIVGGAISTTIATATTTAGTTVGSGYLYPPICIIDAPPAGGLQATAIVTSLSSSTVIGANIQVINQGAGYSTAPKITFLNDPRDTAGGGAVYVTTLTGTTNLTGLYPTNWGAAQTSTPTFTFALTTGAAVSCNATMIMNYTVTAYGTSSTIGSSVSAAWITSINNTVTTSQVGSVSPLHGAGVCFPRPARISGGISAGTVLVAGAVVEDGGLGIEQVPTLVAVAAFSSVTGTLTFSTTASVGGVTDTSFIQAV